MAFNEILQELSQPIPRELVKSRVGWTDRSGREHAVSYVEWHAVADILDSRYPGWSYSILSVTQVGGLIVVAARITIDNVWRDGIGTGEAIDEKGIKKAESDALKRAATKFGIARELYRDGDHEQSRAPSGAGPSAFYPKARGLEDLVTPKQLAAIKALAREQNIGYDDLAEQIAARWACAPEDLSRKGASNIIEALKEGRVSPSRQPAPPPPPPTTADDLDW